VPHQFIGDIGLTLDFLDKNVGVRVSRNAMIFLIFFRVSDQSGRAVRTCTDRKSPPRPPGCNVLIFRPNFPVGALSTVLPQPSPSPFCCMKAQSRRCKLATKHKQNARSSIIISPVKGGENAIISPVKGSKNALFVSSKRRQDGSIFSSIESFIHSSIAFLLLYIHSFDRLAL
jgi:hypothetical protein